MQAQEKENVYNKGTSRTCIRTPIPTHLAIVKANISSYVHTHIMYVCMYIADICGSVALPISPASR